MKKKYRRGVFIVTYRIDNHEIEYLLMKRKLHWMGWEFPKGGIEKGSLIQNTKRELKEETGQSAVKIISYKISGKYLYNKEYPDRPGFTGQTYKLFSAQIKDRKVKLDNREHSEYKWLSYKKAFALLKWQNQKKCLRIVNKKLIGKCRTIL